MIPNKSLRRTHLLLHPFAPLRLCAIFFAWALAIGAGANAGEPLRVMTFNIRLGVADDGADSWPHRKQMLFDVIRDFGPDVLGLQEAFDFQIKEIVAAVPGYQRLGVGRDDGKEAGEYSAILYRDKRLSCGASGTFWLSDTPDVAGSKSWGNEITRICTWAEFTDLASPSPPASGGSPPRAPHARFRAYNTHWDHQSQPAREKSGAMLARRVADECGDTIPALVTGDFNSPEDNAAFRALTGGPAKLADTFRRLHRDAKDVGTFHAFKGSTAGGKIDAILTTWQWEVESAEIVHTSRGGRYPSDHFPVTAVVRLK